MMGRRIVLGRRVMMGGEIVLGRRVVGGETVLGRRVRHRCLQPSSPAIPWRMKVALLVRVMLPLLEVTLMLCVPGGSVEVLRGGKEQGTAGPWSNEHWAPESGMLEAHAVVLTSVGEGRH